MGQTIEINNTEIVDHVLLIDTDRSLAGQDGESYGGVETARLGDTFPAQLAVRLFETDSSVDHVFVMSNSVSVRRPAGWDDEAVSRASSTVAEFFRFYL
jgi:hypothetical protein